MTVEAVDGPYPHDVTINGHGYVLARGIEPSLPFRTQRAKYGYTPTFIERQNVSGTFGDNQQDFWLTATQNDWSLGMGQSYFDSQDPEKVRKYYMSSNLNTDTPGQATAQLTVTHPTDLGSATTGAVAIDSNVGSLFYTTSALNLYQVDPATGYTSLGAHGALAACTAFAFDGTNLYMSSGSNVRKWNVNTSTLASFSATGAESLLYMNNTLYGAKQGVLNTYASTGAATASFTFKDASGAALANYKMKLASLGGKVIILRQGAGPDSLWQWDGTGISMLATFPQGFVSQDLCVTQGIIFVVGVEVSATPSGRVKCSVWFYNSGTIGRTYITPHTSPVSATVYNSCITPYGDGFIFWDPYINKGAANGFLFYNVTTGGTSTLVANNLSVSSSDIIRISANELGFIYTVDGNTGGRSYFGGALITSTQATQSDISSSMFDFGNSLTKELRGVTVAFIPGSNGTSVDLFYTLEDPQNGSVGTLKIGATSGVEYPFPNGTTAHAVGVNVVINTPSGTAPILQRIYVRAAPIQTQFRNAEYILDLSATEGKTPVILRNGKPHPLTGRQQLDQLLTDITSTTPFTVVDRIGTFTAVAELADLEIIELKPEQFYVRMSVRGV